MKPVEDAAKANKKLIDEQQKAIEDNIKKTNQLIEDNRKLQETWAEDLTLKEKEKKDKENELIAKASTKTQRQQLVAQTGGKRSTMLTTARSFAEDTSTLNKEGKGFMANLKQSFGSFSPPTTLLGGK